MRAKRLQELIMHTSYTLSTARLNCATLEGSLSGLNSSSFLLKLQNLFECSQGFPLSSLKSWLWICSLGCRLFLDWFGTILSMTPWVFAAFLPPQLKLWVIFSVMWIFSFGQEHLDQKGPMTSWILREQPHYRDIEVQHFSLWKLRFQVTVNIFSVCSRNCLKNCIWPRLLLPVFITLLLCSSICFSLWVFVHSK